MKRALPKPALLAILILLIVTASGLLIRGNTGAARSPQPPQADEGSPKAVGTRVLAETPPAKAAAKGGETPNAEQVAKVNEAPQAAAAAKAGGSPKRVEERHQLLETVGILTAAHCYQTYLNIGLIADGKVKGSYTQKEASRLLDSVRSVLDSVDRKLAVLGTLDLDKQDRESLEQMRDLSDLLHLQAKQLETLWSSGSDEDAARYENVRKDSWAAISRLTGVGR